MAKILQVVDIQGWAIDTLAQSIVKYNPQHHFETIYIPPREASKPEKLREFYEAAGWADVIHFHYWRTYTQITENLPISAYPELQNKKTILTHHNDKKIFSGNWSTLDAIAVFNDYQYVELEVEYSGKVVKIPYGIDLDRFYWNDEYPPKETKVGYVGRVVRWKRLKPIALACQELGVKLIVMGKMEDREYYKEIVEAMSGEDKVNETIEWHLNTPDDQVRDVYAQMSVFVGNSWDGRESGTMPYQEAMAVGVPVLTTRSGMAKDYAKDRQNCVVLNFNNPDDHDDWEGRNKEDIKYKLGFLLENEELRKKLRGEGWSTIKNYPEERMARNYSQLYHKLCSGELLVSIIVPTYNRVREVIKILNQMKDDYENLEIIVSDDNSDDGTEMKVKQFRENNPDMCIKYLNTERGGYNLAMARNMGVIEAEGGILVFCDSRLLPKKESVESFVEMITGFPKGDKIWLFGDKGAKKNNFVENWSCIRRQHLINAGMFNERIDRYGGMSQELRERFRAQDFQLGHMDHVTAEEMVSADKWSKEKRKDVIDIKLKLWKMNL